VFSDDGRDASAPHGLAKRAWTTVWPCSIDVVYNIVRLTKDSIGLYMCSMASIEFCLCVQCILLSVSTVLPDCT